ncbi:hypothetical protein V2J09_009180 [Rumex salicifolius]
MRRALLGRISQCSTKFLSSYPPLPIPHSRPSIQIPLAKAPPAFSLLRSIRLFSTDDTVSSPPKSDTEPDPESAVDNPAEPKDVSAEFEDVRNEGGAVSEKVSFANPLAVKILHALQIGDISKASDLLSNVSCGQHAFCADDFAYILGYCARNPHPTFAMETWKILEERNIVSDKCYLHIIHSLCNAGNLEEALAFVKCVGDQLRMNFILDLYNCLLLACIRFQDEDRACQCLDLMDSQLVGKNESTYIALLKLAVWKKNLSAVHEIWKEYGKYYNMNIISLRNFIRAFASLNDLQYAYSTMQQMIAVALKGEANFFNSPTGSLSCRQLDIPIPSDNDLSISVNNVDMSNDIMYPQQSTPNDAEILKSKTSVASMLEEHKRVPIMKLIRCSFSDVMQACARSANSMLAEQLFLQMQNLGVDPTRYIFDGFLRAVILERGLHSGIEVLKLMQDRNIKPYDHTFTDLSVSCSKRMDLDLAELLLSETSECTDVYPYNTFLAACRAVDKPERAVKMLAMMKRRKIKLNIKTYELLFSMFIHINAPYEEANMLSRVYAGRRMKAIEMDMLNNEIQHSQRSLKNLLRALGAEGMIRELMQYLRLAEQQVSTQDASLEIEIYNIVLHSLVAAEQGHMAIEIFRNLKMYAYSLNAATYTIMIDYCSNIRCFKSASVILSMMIRDGFMPQVATYCALIKILLDANYFDRALNLLQEAFIDGHQPDVLLFNTFLNRAFIKGRIDIIELIVELMHEWRIRPDPSTCHYVFNAYVEGEFFSTALEALQVLSLRMISEDETVLQETRAEFEEDYILADDLKAELMIMKLFDNSKDNLCFGLLNLRWCTLMGSELTWEPNQSPWSKRLSSAFKGYST